ncbi:hypothetical protein ACJMK2_026340 [Sinanodonta woodiana]|uniref:Uncharacterized protein n=1 Tax=Sinanodonta woodiana TaxID=1069815 RepID=A0ABD3XJA7_SINWO
MDFLESKKGTKDLSSNTIPLWLVVPAHSECEIPVKRLNCPRHTLLFQPVRHLLFNTKLFGRRGIYQIQRGRGRFRLLNPTNKDIILRPGKAITTVEIRAADDIGQPDYEKQLISRQAL